MSRNLVKDRNGKTRQVIESFEVCKWRVDDICCNNKSSHLAEYPYPTEMCYSKKEKEKLNKDFVWKCRFYEKEDGKTF